MAMSSQHNDFPWCVVGTIVIMYHTTLSMSTSVQYDQRTVFGSHGAYAVWTGTDPRSFNLSANLVAANTLEVIFNLGMVWQAYDWTQKSPPPCKMLIPPLGSSMIFNTKVRIESMDASIPESVHLDYEMPIQIDFSMGLKECKAI